MRPDDFLGAKLVDSRDILAVFYASWCPFCRSFLKIFEDTMTKKTTPSGALVDISDESNPLWEALNVNVVPTLVGFRDGEAIARKDGISGAGLNISDLEDALRKMGKD